MKPLYVLENDGHNTPTMHRFRDFRQFAEYVGKDELEAAGVEVEEDFSEIQDENSVLWTNFGDSPELHLTDHTVD